MGLLLAEAAWTSAGPEMRPGSRRAEMFWAPALAPTFSNALSKEPGGLFRGQKPSKGQTVICSFFVELSHEIMDSLLNRPDLVCI